MIEKAQINLRLRPDQREWLDHFAHSENRSLNGAITDLIDQAMRADPLRIVVRHCDLGGETFFDVSVGEYGDAFHDGQDKAAAIEAARSKAKELRLPATAIQFRVENEAGPVFGTVVPSLDDGDLQRCELVARLRAVQRTALAAVDATDAFTGATILGALAEARKCLELKRYEEAHQLLIQLENTVDPEDA